MKLREISVLLFTVLFVSSAEAKLSAAERCEAIKLRNAIEYALDQVHCSIHVQPRGLAALEKCLVVADTRLERAFARADKETACLPSFESARSMTVAYVAALFTAARPSPTPAPTPVSRCGNGVIDPGERCDGQVFCGSSCDLVFTLCCGGDGPPSVCQDIQCSDPGHCNQDQIEVCQSSPAIDKATVGATCAEATSPCAPGRICPGSCQPYATFPPTKFCCQRHGGCIDLELSDTVAVLFVMGEQCIGEGIGFDFVTGTCGPSGQCIPGG